MIRMEKTILVVVGLPGSGKSEVSDYIRSKGIPMFRTGDVIREEVVNRGMELTIKNQEAISKKLREEEGMDAPARRTGEKIKAADSGLICVEGPRDMHEISYLAGLGRLVLLVVDAPDELRFERLKNRGGSRDPKTREEFEWRDRSERERGQGEVLATEKYPKHVIENTGSREELRRKVDKVLKKLL